MDLVVEKPETTLNPAGDGETTLAGAVGANQMPTQGDIGWADEQILQAPDTVSTVVKRLGTANWHAKSESRDRFDLLQRWEGVVTEVGADHFVATLTDLTRPGSPEEEGEFPMAEIAADDEPLVRPGAVFYWQIGYNNSRTGQRRRVSEIRFRRLPRWSEKDKREAEKYAQAKEWFLGAAEDAARRSAG